MKFILIIFLLLSLSVRGQELGSPFLQSYPPKSYRGDAQNWAIAQDYRGVMYFGNNRGVLTYDGVNWQLFPIANNSVIRSLAIDSLDVYVGAQGEFGYMRPDSKGHLQYHSLSGLLSAEYRNFSYIWAVHVSKEGVYFQSDTILFRYAQGQIKKWILKDSYHRSFLIDNQLYIRQEGVGLMRMQADTLALIQGGERFKDNSISVMLMIGQDSLLIGSQYEGLDIYSPQKGVFLDKKGFDLVNYFLVGNRLYHGAMLPTGYIALATVRGGVVMVDKKGNLVKIIDKQVGLQHETINYLYVDSQEALWLALNSGFARLESFDFCKYDEQSGISGTVYAVNRHQETLYAGTELGLFAFKDGRFEEIKEIGTTVWFLLNYKHNKEETLLVGAVDGLFAIKNGKVEPLRHLPQDNIYYMKVSAKNPTRVYCCTSNGVFTMLYQNGEWIQEGFLAGINVQVRSIAEDEDELWLGTRFRGLFRVDIDYQNPSSPPQIRHIQRYDTLNGLPSLKNVRVYRFNQQLVFATQKGFYRFVREKSRFEVDTLLQGAFGKDIVFAVTSDYQRNWWVINDSKKMMMLIKPWINDSYLPDTTTFRRLPIMDFYEPFHEENGVSWLGGSDGLFRYDAFAQRNYHRAYYALIRKVMVGKDSVIYAGNGKAFSPELSYHYNSLTFTFASPFFDGESETLYAYRLDGFDTEWSAWTKETKKEYTNLPEGSYTFKVKAKNIYQLESKESYYAFRIAPPWYRTTFAYFIYLVMIVLAIALITRIYARRLKKQNELLEKIIRNRTVEIVKQKEEIQQKNENITASINYAQRIQRAMLPFDEKIEKGLGKGNFCVLYKPRDIVSGDFYFFEQIEDKLVVAVADCTGHGVPGAFMSMIGNQILSEIILKSHVLEPHLILELLHQEIRRTLRQAENESRDGMDIALCVIDQTAKTLSYSGAMNPLYIIQNQELTAVKPDKRSIGGVESHRTVVPFVKHVFDLNQPTVFYLFSDGYHHQFGGEKKEKFMLKRFRDLLLSIHHEPMDVQKERLDWTIENWMLEGDEPQLDDMLVIGIRAG